MSLFMRAEWAGQWRKGGRKFTPFHTQTNLSFKWSFKLKHFSNKECQEWQVCDLSREIGVRQHLEMK